MFLYFLPIERSYLSSVCGLMVSQSISPLHYVMSLPSLDPSWLHYLRFLMLSFRAKQSNSTHQILVEIGLTVDICWTSLYAACLRGFQDAMNLNTNFSCPGYIREYFSCNEQNTSSFVMQSSDEPNLFILHECI